MKVDSVFGYQDFNDMVKFYDGVADFNDIHVIANPSEVDETNVVFVHNDYTLGIYVSPFKISFKEMGFRLFPDHVFDLDKVKSMDYNTEYIEIFFKDGYEHKSVFINLLDIKKSSFH